MRMGDANRYARWAAIIASLLAVVVLAVLVRRSWQAHTIAKQAPPPVPPSVARTSQTFTLSNTTGAGTLFTLRASSATAYKESDRNLLSDVWITIYGKKGDRNDNILTHSCDYLSASGTVSCGGEVKMDLESAEEARRIAAARGGNEVVPRIVHITTSRVTFNKSTGETVTDQPVEFHFPGGEGRAVGAHYDAGDGVLKLQRDIHLKLAPSPSKGAAGNIPPLPVDLDGSSLDFQRGARTIILRGPVTARQHAGTGGAPGSANAQEERELLAGLLTANLDKEFHATIIIATGDAKDRPQLRTAGAKGNGLIFADQFIADLAPAGWVEHLSAVGDVQGDYRSASETSHVTASRIDAEMVPQINQPKTVTATGGVRANSTRGSATRTIETSLLALDFIPGPPSRAGGQPRYQLSHAQSLAPATVTMSDPIPGQPGSQHRLTTVTGQRIEADFGGHNRMRRMQGHGGTQLDRDLPDHPRQTSTSQEFAAEFDSQGQWTSFDQSGNVRLLQADRSGRASRAHIDRSTDIVTLFGPAEASDASSQTKADSITFNQRTDEIHAEGNVLSTYTGRPGDPRGGAGQSSAGMGTPVHFSSDSAHITSDHLVGNSATGRALYTGHARLWQGDSIMEADEIELNRPARQLDARGNVRAVFLATPSPTEGLPAAPAASGALGAAQGSAEKKPDLWHVRASTLTYYDAESRAHLDNGFTANSQDRSISGENCDIYFVPSTQRANGTSQGIDHAIARGHVVVHQDVRRGLADRADYTAATGKFVLSGGNPTLYDGDGNSIQGRQLTFFQADDTILVESEEGTRTLTRHRVQK